MSLEEMVARHMAAKKMGLIKDPYGERLPDDLWQQMLPAAQLVLNFVEELAEDDRASTAAG